MARDFVGWYDGSSIELTEDVARMIVAGDKILPRAWSIGYTDTTKDIKKATKEHESNTYGFMVSAAVALAFLIATCLWLTPVAIPFAALVAIVCAFGAMGNYIQYLDGEKTLEDYKQGWQDKLMADLNDYVAKRDAGEYVPLYRF